jgi:hypothetical protein
MRRKGDKKAKAISSPSVNPACANGQQDSQDEAIRIAGDLKIQQTPHFVAFAGSERQNHNIYSASRQLENEYFVALSRKGQC